MKKFNPNNFIIDKVFDIIDKKTKSKKKIKTSSMPVRPDIVEMSGPLIVEVNV